MSKTKPEQHQEQQTAENQEEQASPEQQADQSPEMKMYRVTAPANGFRRAGRRWQGVTDVPVNELTAEQVAAIQAEPRLTIIEV